MKTVTLKLRGVAPLLMHNARLADPTDPITREKSKISKGRNKTEETLLAIKELEWRGGLYLDEKGRPSIPADMLLATCINGARKAKLGKEASAAVYCEEAFFPLEYDGPKDLKKLYEDGRFCDYRSVAQQKQRIMRARPIFRQWSVDVAMQVDDEIINPEQVREAMIAAGARVGFGDFRPRYGRFVVE
jgi:hypothetical protein